jgi:hypothetical protein
MTESEAFDLIVFEGTDADGMVVQVRCAIDPGPKRMSRLKEALALLEPCLRGSPTLDRRLANALYGLSFHMSASLAAWKHWQWYDAYFEILGWIEAIFEGDQPPYPPPPFPP